MFFVGGGAAVTGGGSMVAVGGGPPSTPVPGETPGFVGASKASTRITKESMREVVLRREVVVASVEVRKSSSITSAFV
jgi:hypothetical protein